MKLLVFAFKPPPHHGQSYMVQVLLEALGGDVRGRQEDHAETRRCGDNAQVIGNQAAQTVSNLAEKNLQIPGTIECYHVDSRVSESSEDAGKVRLGKLWRMVSYCLKAIYIRFRYGVRNFYYVPAPGVRSAIFRDWIVMILCRPFFRKMIFHWHGVGLGEWIESQAHPIEWWVTHWLLRRADLSIVLGGFYRADVEKFEPKRVEEVANGIPDPCPDYAKSVLPRRQARRMARAQLIAGKGLTPELLKQAGGDPEVFQVFYLSMCVREKGLFDTVEALALVNKELAEAKSPLRVQLTVAGKFAHEPEQQEFENRIGQADLNGSGGKKVVEYVGFVSGAEKDRLLRESDCLCFPTFYPIEGQPVCVVEAMAYGLPVITTRWRAMPEFFESKYPGLVEIRAPEQIAAVMHRFMEEDPSGDFRRKFLERFTVERFRARMRELLLSVE